MNKKSYEPIQSPKKNMTGLRRKKYFKPQKLLECDKKAFVLVNLGYLLVIPLIF
jgi:hypothetical protein